MKNVSRFSLRSLLPKRIRTILIINVVFAVGFMVVQAFSTQAHLRRALGPLTAITVIMLMPLALVERYLYSRKRGWWYQARNGPPVRSPWDTSRGDRAPYPRTRLSDGDVPQLTNKDRTQLFDALPGDEHVSRASIMRTVAARLQAEGKSEAAKRCQDLIDERYGGSHPDAKPGKK